MEQLACCWGNFERCQAGARYGFVSYDVDPARVESHLVAITQHHSVYSEQFRSLRARLTSGRARTDAHVCDHQRGYGRRQDVDGAEPRQAARTN